MSINGEITLKGAILYTGAYAGIVAATAVVVGNPIGAAGGAMYGACHGITYLVANELINGGPIKSVVASIFAFIGATAATWKLASLYGCIMSFKTALLLGASPTAVITTIVVTGLLAIYLLGSYNSGSASRATPYYD